MAFFLKKYSRNNKTYLSIYESFYSSKKKGTAHKSFKALGSLESHIANGIADPIAHFQNEVDALNQKKNELSSPQISELSPMRHLGYFPLKSIMEKMEIRKYLNYFTLANNLEFDLFELLSSLIYARAVNPCSKRRTFLEVLPQILESHNFSYDQLLDGLDYLGNDYNKFVELFALQTSKSFGVDASTTYFDCTNFYFEIDREDDFRRKGPSKENRKDPIVGLGLLLDNNQIPICMKLFAGNESERPVLRDVIDEMKGQHNINGRTIHVADKGLNCAQNIYHSKINKDGYLFSKSVKTLPKPEQNWVLHDLDFKEVRDAKGVVLYKYKSCIDEYPYIVEHEGKKEKINITEKRLVTYNPSLAAKKRYEINRMVEKARALTHSQAKRKDYGESGKYVTFTDKEGKKACVSINDEAIQKDLQLAGYNLLVTSELKMKDKDIYDTYHNLWRIEESFRVMKSDLDARPVYVQKETTICGHFLICYLTVLLERILQFNVLNNKISTSELFRFIRGFNVTSAEHNYINTATLSPCIKELATRFKLPLTNCFLSDKQVQMILNYKLQGEFKKK